MKKTALVLILTVICCNESTNATIITIEPSATGYALDYNYENYTYDGTFDRYYGNNPKSIISEGKRIWDDDDVRVGLPDWGEARGIVEFRLSGVPYEIYVYEQEPTRNNPNPPYYILTLDRIFLRRHWFSGSIIDTKTTIYGYNADGYMAPSDIQKMDYLVAENIGRNGSIDVTNFIKDLKDGNNYYAGFTLKETRYGALLNYGSFYLDAYYIPEPTTLSLLALGAVLLKKRK